MIDWACRHRHALFAALLLSGLGCRDGAPADPVILSIDGQELHREEFERYAAEVQARGEAVLDPAVRSALLQSFLEKRVLVLEARARGQVKPGATGEEETAAVQKLLAQEVPWRDVSDGDVQAYYEAHKAERAVPEMITLRQIVVATANEARDVRRRLQKQPKSFVALARDLSKSPEAGEGGLMGRFSRGQLPAELEGPAFALAVGQISDVVQTTFGYHVLRVDAREPAHEPTLEESRERLRTELSRQSADRRVREYVAGLLARAKVNHEAVQARPSSS